MSTGSENLRSNQRQLDMDGCEVGVSRQALDETLEQHANMLATLQTARIVIKNRDPSTSEGKLLAVINAVCAAAE